MGRPMVAKIVRQEDFCLQRLPAKALTAFLVLVRKNLVKRSATVVRLGDGVQYPTVLNARPVDTVEGGKVPAVKSAQPDTWGMLACLMMSATI